VQSWGADPRTRPRDRNLDQQRPRSMSARPRGASKGEPAIPSKLGTPPSRRLGFTATPDTLLISRIAFRAAWQAKENSPAIYRWVPAREGQRVPSGTKELGRGISCFLRAGRGSGELECANPSDESPGSSRASLRDSPHSALTSACA
jgi:hypothetical protein